MVTTQLVVGFLAVCTCLLFYAAAECVRWYRWRWARGGRRRRCIVCTKCDTRARRTRGVFVSMVSVNSAADASTLSHPSRNDRVRLPPRCSRCTRSIPAREQPIPCSTRTRTGRPSLTTRLRSVQAIARMSVSAGSAKNNSRQPHAEWGPS